MKNENQSIKAQLDISKAQLIDEYENELKELSNRNSRLETEYNLLQRETAKKDVKVRTSQRDIVRLQSLQAKHSETVKELESKIEDANKQAKDCEFQYKKKIDSLNSEQYSIKNELTERIKELEILLSDTKAENENLQQQLQQPIALNSDNVSEGGLSEKQRQCDLVRDQMGFIRNMIESQKHQDDAPKKLVALETQENFIENSNGTNKSRNDIYSNQLNKLLRLAEEAIGTDTYAKI